MQLYNPPIEDFRFVLEAAGYEDLLSFEGFEDFEMETAMAILEEGGRFCAREMLELNRIGDTEPLGFDPKTGAVTGPDSVLMYPDSLGAPLPGTTSRARYHAEAERFYVAGRQGSLVAIDVSDPDALQFLSVWSDGSTLGETQDVRIVDFGDGPRVLMVNDNEGFRILDPNDGL